MRVKISSFFLNIIAFLAYYEAKESVNSACLFWHHQPEIPKEVCKLNRNLGKHGARI